MNSHEIVIGGNFNEDISKNTNSRRASKLKELIANCELQINFHGPTFINAKGVEVSEIDYFLYKTTAQVPTEKIDDTHLSDHHPIKLKLIRTYSV
jgi:endonuclease/exonuclease/phosphatase family metal-dependent hydrolase